MIYSTKVERIPTNQTNNPTKVMLDSTEGTSWMMHIHSFNEIGAESNELEL
ncbi:hypothetical protein [Bacillus sp. PS06]|uniref:hypothetical protein n=1 Tax=Bacillus sp. PS06 TaxID=2764176 RepID=UPI00177FD857|nr:hypothetical protein [Bacillus sp. PS06]MBD8070065.1 hypothetical protein [Bacillus sp. PS06]